MIKTVYERVTGRPWTTGRSAVVEFGPTVATRYPELADYPDEQLLTRPLAELVAEIEQRRARLAAADRQEVRR